MQICFLDGHPRTAVHFFQFPTFYPFSLCSDILIWIVYTFNEGRHSGDYSTDTSLETMDKLLKPVSVILAAKWKKESGVLWNDMKFHMCRLNSGCFSEVGPPLLMIF
jgi:hypothetical protein